MNFFFVIFIPESSLLPIQSTRVNLHKWNLHQFLFVVLFERKIFEKSQKKTSINKNIKLPDSRPREPHLFLWDKKIHLQLKQQQNLPDYTIKHYFFLDNIFSKAKNSKQDTSCSPGTKQNLKKKKKG